jgi:hypothetical protein
MADNLNTPYLGQLGASDNLNTPFLPETASEATINARSDFSTRGELHSQGDAVVGGTLSVTGVVTNTAGMLVPDGTEALPAIAFTSEASLGFRRSADSVLLLENAEFTIADGGLNVSSVITSTDGQGDFGSVATAANDTGMPDGAFRFVNTASGISLAYRSGGTTYYMGASTISES